MGEIVKDKVKGSMINTDVSNQGTKTDIKNNKFVLKGNIIVNLPPELVELVVKTFWKKNKNQTEE